MPNENDNCRTLAELQRLEREDRLLDTARNTEGFVANGYLNARAIGSAEIAMRVG